MKLRMQKKETPALEMIFKISKSQFLPWKMTKKRYKAKLRNIKIWPKLRKMNFKNPKNRLKFKNPKLTPWKVKLKHYKHL